MKAACERWLLLYAEDEVAHEGVLSEEQDPDYMWKELCPLKAGLALLEILNAFWE